MGRALISGPYGPGAHLGPGPIWAQGPYGPMGPGPGPFAVLRGPGPGARALPECYEFFPQKSRPGIFGTCPIWEIAVLGPKHAKKLKTIFWDTSFVW